MKLERTAAVEQAFNELKGVNPSWGMYILNVVAGRVEAQRQGAAVAQKVAEVPEELTVLAARQIVTRLLSGMQSQTA